MGTSQSRTAPENQPSPGTLEDLRLPVKARLAAAWASFMFLYIYVDYFALYKPGFLDELLAGKVHTFQTGPAFISVGITLVSVPALMVLLAAVLPARVNRIVNLVVAGLYVPVTVFNAASETTAYAYFYAFTIGCELLLLALVVRWAWTWPRRTPQA